MAKYRLYIKVKQAGHFVDKPMGVYEGIQNARRHAMPLSDKSESYGCIVSEVLSARTDRTVGVVWSVEEGIEYKWGTKDRNNRKAGYILLSDGSLGKKLW